MFTFKIRNRNFIYVSQAVSLMPCLTLLYFSFELEIKPTFYLYVQHIIEILNPIPVSFHSLPIAWQSTNTVLVPGMGSFEIKYLFEMKDLINFAPT